MLVEVVVAVKHVALGPERRITPSAPSLLHIVLERIGDVVVNDEAYVLLVHAHAKSRRGHDDLDIILDEELLLKGLYVIYEKNRVS